MGWHTHTHSPRARTHTDSLLFAVVAYSRTSPCPHQMEKNREIFTRRRISGQNVISATKQKKRKERNETKFNAMDAGKWQRQADDQRHQAKKVGRMQIMQIKSCIWCNINCREQRATFRNRKNAFVCSLERTHKRTHTYIQCEATIPSSVLRHLHNIYTLQEVDIIIFIVIIRFIIRIRFVPFEETEKRSHIVCITRYAPHRRRCTPLLWPDNDVLNVETYA